MEKKKKNGNIDIFERTVHYILVWRFTLENYFSSLSCIEYVLQRSVNARPQSGSGHRWSPVQAFYYKSLINAKIQRLMVF